MSSIFFCFNKFFSIYLAALGLSYSTGDLLASFGIFCFGAWGSDDPVLRPPNAKS